MKKYKLFLMVCVMIAGLFLLVGCPAPEEEAQNGEEAPPPEEAFPSGPVTLIVPFGAGGSHDLHARVITASIPAHLGAPMVVELRPGGGGAIGSEEVAKATADGYILLFGGSGPNISLHHARELPYTRESFVPIAQINHSPSFLAVLSDSPFQTLDELVNYARANPGKLTYASTGAFGSGHIAAEMFFDAAGGLDIVHVPFDGGGPALMALLGGQVDFAFLMPTQLRDLFDAGDVRLLGGTDTVRDHGNLADVPTMVEEGYDVQYTMRRFVLAPAGTPQNVVDHLREAFRILMEDPTFIALIEQLGETIHYVDGPEFQKLWDEDFAAQEETIKRIAE
jgi:tripartite-type tricarboxylate transporter receptor subunit TctC